MKTMQKASPAAVRPLAQSSPWISLGGTLLVGLFVAQLDRSNLSVVLPQLSKDMGFAGDPFPVTSSLVLTTFLVGYGLANILGGVLTRNVDPKPIVTWCFALWSLATIAVSFSNSLLVLLACRFVLGVAEGLYWPQQSRFARAWFAPAHLTKANSVIQYYGQFIALSVGFFILTPIYDYFGWRTLFFLSGLVGLVVIVPLFSAVLRRESEAPYGAPFVEPTPPPKISALAEPGFALLVFSFVTQGMLFWGITLWIPLTVRSLGFTGWGQAAASAVPFLVAVLLAPPMAAISDRGGRRVTVACLGLLGPGILLLLLPLVSDGYGKLLLISLALGWYGSSTIANTWAILQQSIDRRLVGTASGIMNGIGAGGGGTLAGFLVGLSNQWTGSYTGGFFVLGGVVVLGSAALLAAARLLAAKVPTT